MSIKAAIVQARIGSSRLPGKVLADINGIPLIIYLLERLKRCQRIDKIVVATTEEEEDDKLVEVVETYGVEVVRGPKDDVLKRYKIAAEAIGAEVIVRITGDCPLVDPELIENMMEIFMSEEYDYICNCEPPTYPDGLDIEIFSRGILECAQRECKNFKDREHVTQWMRKNDKISKKNIISEDDYSCLRWTVDEPEDLELIRHIAFKFEENKEFGWKDILSLYNQKEEIMDINTKYGRNEGMNIEKGQKLWRRAKRIIPGGNMLLSKRAEMFLPEKWPAYYSKAEGCNVWDLDGRKFIDMSIMGIGTNILGYGNKNVDMEVLRNIQNGNMSTLNCPEEVYLAEKLVELHEWAEMVKFARSGGEANAIAVRIARAATGRDAIAICGYHGWHDWYLATNLKNKGGLEEHLLPGLAPAGVPKGLKGTVHPFSFNRIDQLKKIISENNLAAVKMEVQRSEKPEPGFLEEVRSLCNNNGIVLIFDECTSGFRERYGGIHLKYGIEPDMAMFGKALGNGYAITAVIGKSEVMNAAQSTFISSTFWTERIGPTAAIATLEEMKRQESWSLITETGKQIQEGWKKMALENGLKIRITGIPALSNFSFVGQNSLKYKTLITQEMLKKGYLASNSCYVCTAHTEEIVEEYMEELNKVFKLIAICEEKNNIDEILEGPICHSGFRRLN